MDRTPGSESLEVLLPHRPCVSVDDCTCPPQGPPHATATPEQENEAWYAKLYMIKTQLIDSKEFCLFHPS